MLRHALCIPRTFFGHMEEWRSLRLNQGWGGYSTEFLVILGVKAPYVMVERAYTMKWHHLSNRMCYCSVQSVRQTSLVSCSWFKSLRQSVRMHRS